MYPGAGCSVLANVTTNKRIADLTDYSSVLHDESELLGLYQSMIEWQSQRMTQRRQAGIETARDGPVS